MELLAKPNETILEHTQHLLIELNRLKHLYGDQIDIDWNALALCCKWHDIGKINPQFQTKIRKNTHESQSIELYHNFVSAILLQPKKLYDTYLSEGLSKEDAKNKVSAISYAISCHHIRPFHPEYEQPEQLKQLIDSLSNHLNLFEFEQLHLTKPEAIKLNYRKFIQLGTYPIANDRHKDYYDQYVLLKGFLNKIDYAASGNYPIEIREEKTQSLPNQLDHWKNANHITWNPAQEYSYVNRNKSLIFIAQTGIGKTEAALRWIDSDKAFFTLPLQTAINNIYDRIKDNIMINSSNQSIGLLHSNAMDHLTQRTNNQIDRQLAKSYVYPLTISTIDQLFKFVYRYDNYENLYVTFMYAKVVIDEIQAYDASLTAYILYGLKMIQDLGGRYLIMSATIPPYLIDLMREYNLDIPNEIPAFYNQSLNNRHIVKVNHAELTTEEVIKNYQHNKTLIICNTVKKAIELHHELSKKLPHVIVKCFHSRFIKKDRKLLEREILASGRDTYQEPIIWITTQIIEASLDIDFDCLLTELSELSGLYQRMGRCYRNRNNTTNNYNIFVYDGGDTNPSGIHKDFGVVDYQLYHLSKKAIANLDGLLTEKEKTHLLNETYQTNNVKETDFYHKIKDTISFLEALKQTRLKEKEVIKRFRHIETLTVIPQSVYLENKSLIDQACYEQDLNTVMDYTTTIYQNKQYLITDHITIKNQVIGIVNSLYDTKSGLQFD